MNIKVKIGNVRTYRNGKVNDSRFDVAFEGDKLGYLTTYNGEGEDDRGVTQTLYRVGDRLILHTEVWSRWVGESCDEYLSVVQTSDLEPNGEHWPLGLECGFGRPLTLDEALIRSADR